MQRITNRQKKQAVKASILAKRQAKTAAAIAKHGTFSQAWIDQANAKAEAKRQAKIASRKGR